MKTLYVVRHAKSSWDAPHLDDFDRPLAPRGKAAAPRMARFMRTHQLVPDRVICSTARRARDTWQMMSPELGDGIDVVYEDDLYGASAGHILEEVKAQDDDVERLMVVGHNPGLEYLVSSLAGNGEPAVLSRMRAKYPTAALAVITFDVERWGDVDMGGGTLDRFVRPRDL